MFPMQDIRLNRGIPIPLYYQLRQQILDLIKSHEMKPGDQIPNEMDFVSQLAVSRSTVRQAVGELVSEGVLVREKAKGTFIARPKVDEGFFQKLLSFNDEMIQKGLRPSTQVLELKTLPAVEEINRRLGLNAGARLIYLKRVRAADGEPVVYLETYLSHDRYPALLGEDFERQSLYGALESGYGDRVVKVVREIEAVQANAAVARRLNIRVNAAVCLVRTMGYLAGGEPVEYSVARYRGDRNIFRVELHR